MEQGMKQTFKKRLLKIFLFLQNILFHFGVFVRYTQKVNDYNALIEKLECIEHSYDLVRIGGNGDGSYYIPSNLAHIDFCVSPGVGPTSEFEADLEKKYQIPSLLIDASVMRPPQELKTSRFIRKFVSNHDNDKFMSIETATTLAKSSFDAEKLGILQMDIEGCEYHTLLGKVPYLREHYDIIILEIHFLDMIKFPFFYSLVDAFFTELTEHYSIIVRQNNSCCGSFYIGDSELPRVMELTLTRKINDK